jgi:hypothetical protein
MWSIVGTVTGSRVLSCLWSPVSPHLLSGIQGPPTSSATLRVPCNLGPPLARIMQAGWTGCRARSFIAASSTTLGEPGLWNHDTVASCGSCRMQVVTSAAGNSWRGFGVDALGPREQVRQMTAGRWRETSWPRGVALFSSASRLNRLIGHCNVDGSSASCVTNKSSESHTSHIFILHIFNCFRL